MVVGRPGRSPSAAPADGPGSGHGQRHQEHGIVAPTGADVGSNLTERPADIAADRTAALQTMPCDHLVLYLYIIPHTLPADNEIDATRPFGIEVRISYAGRRLRTEKREINQWSGASVEMRVDSKK